MIEALITNFPVQAAQPEVNNGSDGFFKLAYRGNVNFAVFLPRNVAQGRFVTNAVAQAECELLPQNLN